jgi:hypothetical protein
MPTSAGTRTNPAAAKRESNANAWRIRSARINATPGGVHEAEVMVTVSVEDREGAPLQILTDEDALKAPGLVE